MKRILITLFLMLVVSTTFAQTVRGDANGDEQVNIADVTILIDYLLSGDASAVNLENADCNLDSSVTIADVTALIDYLLIGSWEPYAPQTETFTVRGVTFTIVIVEGGTFMMGATEEQGTVDPEENEYPVHEVTLSSYGIGQTEVTQELWEAVMSWHPDTLNEDFEAEFIHPSYFSSKNGFDDDLQRPVENISNRKIDLFLSFLNTLTGREFRLPTDAEWEFAARGGNQSKGYKYAGSNDIDEVAWYSDNNGVHTNLVATKAPNELGLYDMSGNVYEWCQDWFGSYSSSTQSNPTGPSSGSLRVRRGGGWGNDGGCRVSYRGRLTPSLSLIFLGFRLAL